MQNFFARPATQWAQPNGSLHVYLLPDPAQAAELEATADRLVWDGSHARQPGRWLHATVRRLPGFSTEVDVEPLIAALDADLAGVPPFELVLDELSLGEVGVALGGSATPAWEGLIDTVEAAARRALPEQDEPWPGRPRAPHVSLSYGVADLDTPELSAVMAGLSLRQRWRVDRVSLVAVDQHRDTGSYTWIDLATHALAGTTLME